MSSTRPATSSAWTPPVASSERGVRSVHGQSRLANHLGARWLAANQTELDAITAKVATYANQRVAHSDHYRFLGAVMAEATPDRVAIS